MVKFTSNSDPSTGTGDIVLNTFEDLNAKEANISTIQAASLDVSEGLNVDGKLTAASTSVSLAEIGNVKIYDNIITLIDGSIYDEIIIKADNVQLTSEGAAVNLAKITTTEVEIKDTVINIAKNNTNSAQDRGIIFNYISSTGTDIKWIYGI